MVWYGMVWYRIGSRIDWEVAVRERRAHMRGQHALWAVYDVSCSWLSRHLWAVSSGLPCVSSERQWWDVEYGQEYGALFWWTEYHVFYRYSKYFILAGRIPYFVKTTEDGQEYGQNTVDDKTRFWITNSTPPPSVVWKGHGGMHVFCWVFGDRLKYPYTQRDSHVKTIYFMVRTCIFITIWRTWS